MTGGACLRARSSRWVAVVGAVALAVPVVAAATLLTSTPAAAAPFTVINNNDSGPGSLRAAITAAVASTDPSNTITVKPGVGTINLAATQLIYNR